MGELLIPEIFRTGSGDINWQIIGLIIVVVGAGISYLFRTIKSRKDSK